jgi:hypothetical protein
MTAAPASFTNLPLSADSTLAEVVAALDSIGLSGVSFQSWYTAAHAKDPSLTPYQGGSIWLAGQDLSGGLGAAATAAGTATDQAAQGATTGADQFAQSVSNPLDALAAIGAFFGNLSQANTWIRVGKVVVGGLLLVLGLVHITGVDSAAASVVKKVPLPV